MTSGQSIVGTQQVTKDDVKAYLMSLINTLATEDANGFVIGIIRNDITLLQQTEAYLDKTLKFVFKDGKILNPARANNPIKTINSLFLSFKKKK